MPQSVSSLFVSREPGKKLARPEKNLRGTFSSRLMLIPGRGFFIMQILKSLKFLNEYFIIQIHVVQISAKIPGNISEIGAT